MSDDNSSQDSRSRIARRIFPDGVDPDPRFTLANERTFLAWIRSSLAFLAGGIAIEIFNIEGVPAWINSTVSFVVIVTAALVAVGAAIRWDKVERAMRTGKPMPAPRLVPVLSAAAAIGCVFGLVVILL